MNIGKKIKEIRIQQHLTQQKIAETCGFTRGLLSKIEKGTVIPPIGTLNKIAHALDVKLSTILEEDPQTGAAHTANVIGKDDAFSMTDKGYSMFPVAPRFVNKKMQPMFIHVKKEEAKKAYLSHEGDEYIYIIEGFMVFKIGNTCYDLHKGDSLYFNCQDVHGIESVPEEVYYLDIFSI